MVPVLQYIQTSVDQQQGSIIEPPQSFEKTYEAEITALKQTELVPSEQCLTQLFSKLALKEQATK